MFEDLKISFANYYRKRALNSSRKAILDYIQGLKQMSDEDLGVILAVSTVIRVNMEEHGYLPKDLYSELTLKTPNELGSYQMTLNKLVRDFNKTRQHTDAVGTLLISYSLRCLSVQALWGLGRDMWVEMQRGMPHGEMALKQGEEEKGEPFLKRVWQEWQIIPKPFKNE